MFAGSDAYERFMGRWSRLLAPRFVRFVSVRDGDTVLDAGSATGALAHTVASMVSSVRVTGIDPSSEYVRHAKAHTADERIEFRVGDAQALELPNGAFDRTLALLVLNFIPDPAKALREMIRVTKADGLVAAAVWDYGDGMQMLRAFWDEAAAIDSAAAARDEGKMPLCREGELTALWRAHGLDRVEEEPIVVDLRFASFDDYWQPFLGGQGPAGAYASALAEEPRAALEARLRRRFLGGAADRPFTLPARAWAVKGVVVDPAAPHEA